MSNKDTTDLLRRVRKQGAELKPRGRGKGIAVYGPEGMYIIHTSLSAGAPLFQQRKGLRDIGFDV